MAKFYLINAVRIGTVTHWPGSVVDDTFDDVAKFTQKGAALWRLGDAVVDAAALKLAEVRRRGGSIEEAERIMREAVDNLQQSADDSSVVYTPTGTAADAANLQALLTEKVVKVGPGVLLLTSALVFTGISNLVLSFHPNTSIVSALPNGTGQTNSPFYSATTLGATANVSVNVTVGTTRIDVDQTSSFPVGTTIAVGAGNRFSYYTVKARSTASGAGFLTAERPVLWAFTTSDDVFVISAISRGLHIFGNGATISGTGDRAFELTGVQDCVVDGFRIDASAGFGGIVTAFDIGGLRNTFRNITITGGYGAQAGIALESNEGSLIDHCSVVSVTNAATNPGIFMADNMDCHVRHSSASLNQVGLEFNYGGAPGEGSKRCSVFGSMFSKNASHGIQVLNGSLEVQIEATQSRWNGGNGVYLANNATGVQLVNVNLSGNTGSGLQIVAGSSASVVNGVLKDNGACGVDTGGDFIGIGLDVSGNLLSAGVQVTGAANAQVSSSKLAGITAAATYSDCIMMSSTGTLLVSDCTFNLSGGGTKVAIEHNATGTVQVVNCKIVAAGSHGYYTTLPTAKLRRGSNVDFALATTPWTTQVANFGSATLVAGTVTVANTLVTASDRIKITKRTAGGTEGHPRISAITAATSFVITSSSGTDTSTFEWEF